MKSKFQLIAAVLFAVVLTACGGGSSKNQNTAPVVAQPDFKSIDTVTGTGAVAANNNLLVVNYVGYLYDSTKADFKGAKFDSSVDRNVPFSFTLGVGQVIVGWDQGVVGMKVGGKRTLIIPAQQAYGANAHAAQAPIGNITYAAIPANAPLVFDIELLSVQVGSNPVAVAPPTSLQIHDTLPGTGAVAANGNTLTVKYTGYVYDGTRVDLRGGIFDSSVVKGTTFDFKLGAGQVIAGWDQGLVGMAVGGKRTLTIPPNLGYGASAVAAAPAYNGTTFVGIPANSTLIFDVELVAIK